MKQKQTFKTLFAGFAIILALLPVFAALNSFLTEGLNRAGWWQPIQDFIVRSPTSMASASFSSVFSALFVFSSNLF